MSFLRLLRLVYEGLSWLTSWFANTLSWWQWLILAVVPPAIIALYFLKLKRRPLEVPSTYLWHKSIEDLHVNTIWQRLRRNLLLLLQLLLILVLAAALLRPSWQQRKLSGHRFIFVVDTSASMQATDVKPSRLHEAKRQVGELIDQMHSGDVAMIISFADTARVEQPFSDDRRRLHRALEAIQPTERSTALLEALRVASGLANPGRSAEDITDVRVAEALPADLYIFSDGRFGPVAGFSLGNLRPVFVPVGRPEAANVGVVTFRVGRNESRPDQLEAFARLENFGLGEADVSVELYRDGRLDNAARAAIAPGESQVLAFPLGTIESGVLRLKVTAGDHLAVDDEAHAVINPPRRAQVLLVTPGNEPLELAMKTQSASEIADVRIEGPEFLKTKDYQALAAGGTFDLVIFDQCQPEAAPQGGSAAAGTPLPQCNTMWVGVLPPQGGWAVKAKAAAPLVIDTARDHPLMQWVDMADVKFVEGESLVVPAGGEVLVDTDAGPLLAIAPREEFEDLVLGFKFIEQMADKGGKPEKYVNTNWPIRSFPAFTLNMFEYLGGSRRAAGLEDLRPGRPVPLEVPPGASAVRIRTPSGKVVDLPGAKSGKVAFTDTGELGVYQVEAGGKPVQQFAVNLFDPAESAVRPEANPALKIGHVEVAGESPWQWARRELWKYLVLLGLGVLLLEWYIYKRRVQW